MTAIAATKTHTPIRSKFVLMLLLTGALFTIGAKWTERPIADIQNVAGKWRGSGHTAKGQGFSITFIIKEDGSYESKARWSSGSLAGEGTMRIIDGKLRWKSGSTGLDFTTILYEGKKAKRMLKSRRTDGLTFKVKQSKKKPVIGTLISLDTGELIAIRKNDIVETPRGYFKIKRFNDYSAVVGYYCHMAQQGLWGIELWIAEELVPLRGVRRTYLTKCPKRR